MPLYIIAYDLTGANKSQRDSFIEAIEEIGELIYEQSLPNTTCFIDTNDKYKTAGKVLRTLRVNFNTLEKRSYTNFRNIVKKIFIAEIDDDNWVIYPP